MTLLDHDIAKIYMFGKLRKKWRILPENWSLKKKKEWIFASGIRPGRVDVLFSSPPTKFT